VKLPAHRAGLPGKEVLFFDAPLNPAYKAGLAGCAPGQSIMFFSPIIVICRTWILKAG